MWLYIRRLYLLWQVRAVDAFDNLVDNVRRPQEELRFYLEVTLELQPYPQPQPCP